MKISKRAWGFAVVLLLLAPALAACGQSWKVSTPLGEATCTANIIKKFGHCVVGGQTYAASALPGHQHASGPAEHKSSVPTQQSDTPAPPVTVTATPASQPTPTQTAQQDSVQQQVWNCWEEQPSTSDHDTLVSITQSNGTGNSLATCLQIPPQTMALFLKLVLQYAEYALTHGSDAQHNFVTADANDGNNLPHAVQQCTGQA